MNESVVDEFGRGVNLRARPGELGVGSAVDLRDVWFPEPGAVATRPGLEAVSADLGANLTGIEFFRTSTGSVEDLVVGSAGGRLDAYDLAGVSQDSDTGPTADYWSFARLGTPTQEYLWCANGVDALWAYEGTNFSQPALTGDAGVGRGRYVCVQPTEYRLVNACFSGATGGLADDNNPSTVRFHDKANPLVCQSLNFVQITPGDGEGITGCASFREFVFVFKESRIAVFHGNSLGASSTPVFNFDVVDAGIGCSFRGAVCTGRDGVYFVHRTGIYRISGMEDPVKVSDAVDPLFTGDLSFYYELNGGAGANLTALDGYRLSWNDEKLYVMIPTGASTSPDTTLMLDTRIGAWTIWNLPAYGMVPVREKRYFALADARQRIAYQADGLVDDIGEDINGWWQGAYQMLAELHGTTVTRQLGVTGAGKFYVETGGDYLPPSDAREVDFASGINLWGGGGGPDVWDDGLWGPDVELKSTVVRHDSVRALRHSLRLSSVDGTPWVVHRAVHYYYGPSLRPVEA